jgi:hypothetical protein
MLRRERSHYGSNNRHALNLDHHLRLRKTRDRDRGAGWKILAENFRAQFCHLRGVARVDQEHHRRPPPETNDFAGKFGIKGQRGRRRLCNMAIGSYVNCT